MTYFSLGSKRKVISFAINDRERNRQDGTRHRRGRIRANILGRIAWGDPVPITRQIGLLECFDFHRVWNPRFDKSPYSMAARRYWQGLPAQRGRLSGRSKSWAYLCGSSVHGGVWQPRYRFSGIWPCRCGRLSITRHRAPSGRGRPLLSRPISPLPLLEQYVRRDVLGGGLLRDCLPLSSFRICDLPYYLGLKMDHLFPSFHFTRSRGINSAAAYLFHRLHYTASRRWIGCSFALESFPPVLIYILTNTMGQRILP